MYFFDEIKSITRPAFEYNEDTIGISKEFLFVIDGATSLEKNSVNSYKTDAQWFSNVIKQEIYDSLKFKEKAIPKILLNAVKNAKILYNNSNPSASISILRINDKYLECFQLGDCPIIIKLKNGKYKILLDNKVSDFDKSVINSMINISKERKISIKESRSFVSNLLLQNRKKANKADGYWILDLNGKGIEHSTLSLIDLNNVDSVSIMSDGFSSLYQTYNFVEDFSKLFELMGQNSLEYLLDTIYTIQENDLDWNKFPRIKFRDDASAIWAKVIK